MPGYNRNLDRFKTNIEDARTGTLASANMFGEGYKYFNNKEGGLLGNFSSQGSQPAFSSLTEAENFRNANPNNSSVAQGLINKAYKGVAPDDYAKKASNFLEQNMGTPGTEGKGLLGGIEQMGQGLNTLTGGLSNKVAQKAGSFAMEKMGGNFLKEKGAEFMASKAGTALGSMASGASGLLAGASAVAGPLMLAKAAYDMVGASKDAYDSAVQGQQNIGQMKNTVASERNTARANMSYMNDEVENMLKDRRGNLRMQLGGKAEQVIAAGNKAAARSNLESNEGTDRAISANKEGIVTAYTDNSNQLERQKDNLQMQNIQAYGNMNQQFIAQGNELQASWDELDETRKDNKLGAKVGSYLGM